LYCVSTFTFIPSSFAKAVMKTHMLLIRHVCNMWVSTHVSGWNLGRATDTRHVEIYHCNIQDLTSQLTNQRTNQLHRAEPFLRSRQSHNYSRISQHFMEPEGSLPCSQQPSTVSDGILYTVCVCVPLSSPQRIDQCSRISVWTLYHWMPSQPHSQ
jgi:hypothetical protein